MTKTTHDRATTIAAIRYAAIQLGMGPIVIREQERRFEQGANLDPTLRGVVRKILEAPDLPTWEDAYAEWVGE